MYAVPSSGGKSVLEHVCTMNYVDTILMDDSCAG